MKKYAHQLFNLGFCSLVACLLGMPLALRLIIAPFLFMMGLFNDALDFHILKVKKHRNGLSHSFTSIVPCILFLLAILFLAPLDLVFALQMGFLLAVSYEIHLCLDALNPSGVYLWGKRKIAGTIRYDSFVFNFIFSLVGGGLFLGSLLFY